MPTIKVGKFEITVRTRETTCHHRPHVHVHKPGHGDASIAIDKVEVLAYSDLADHEVADAKRAVAKVLGRLKATWRKYHG